MMLMGKLFMFVIVEGYLANWTCSLALITKLYYRIYYSISQ
jgi:hypothetical protein